MLHTNNPIIKHKAGLLNLAEELSNVSRACKVMGVSRDTFYRYQELANEALIDKSRRSPNLKNRVDRTIEDAVKTYAIDYPAHGQHRTSNELRKLGIFVSGSGVRSIWLRHDLENFKKRLKALEAKVASEGILLNDGQVAALEKRRRKMKPAVKLRRRILAISARKILSMWVTLKAWAVSTNRPKLIPIVKSLIASSTPPKPRSWRLIYSTIKCYHSMKPMSFLYCVS